MTNTVVTVDCVEQKITCAMILARLYSIDDSVEKNDVGLNRSDKDFVKRQYAEIPEARCARILAKYRKTQLSLEEVKIVNENIEHNDIGVVIDANYIVYIKGFSDKKQFALYLELAKIHLKARYIADKKGWQIKPDQLDACVELFQSKGFLVFEFPNATKEERLEVAKVMQKSVELVTVSMQGDKISFATGGYSERSKVFNLIFSNKSGLLSGLTEYEPNTHARLTCSFSLASEAIKVLQEHAFEVKLSPVYQAALAAYTAKEDAFKSQDSRVTAALADGVKLFAHQNKAVDFLEKAQGIALIGAAMGSGKSNMALSYAAINNMRVCVICPKVVRKTWLREAVKFYPKAFQGKTFECVKRTTKVSSLSEYKIVSMNYEQVEKWADLIEGFDLLVCDESHLAKNFKSKRTKAVLELSRKFKHKILMSGTAVKNDRYELHPQLQLLNPTLYNDNCDLFKQPHGSFWHSIQHIYLPMLKSDVLSFLPSKTVKRVDISVDDPAPLPTNVGDVMLKKHESATSKIDVTIETIQDILDNSDDCILVFSEFVDVCKAIHEHFADKAIYHDGQMTDDARDRAKETFQNPETEQRILVSTRQSLAVGATLTRANQVVFNDLPWNSADIEQASDRCHRISQHKPVTCHWIVADNSPFDVRIVELIEKKHKICKAVTEGRQISAEEAEFLKRPISMCDIVGKD